MNHQEKKLASCIAGKLKIESMFSISEFHDQFIINTLLIRMDHMIIVLAQRCSSYLVAVLPTF